jgi:pimeloyl-ACP methyl ester carboxylesterase
MQGTHAIGETRFLEIEGGRIAYDDTGGDGFPIIALPGMGDLRAQYRHPSPALQKAGYRIITMDIRGFGESSAEWIDYSAWDEPDDACRVRGSKFRDNQGRR